MQSSLGLLSSRFDCERETAVALAAVLALGAFRAGEVVAGVPLRLGALVWSTTLVVLVVLGLHWTDTVSIRDLGDARASRAILVGGVGVAGVQAVGLLLEVAALASQGLAGRLVVEATTAVTGATAPDQVLVYLAFGVVLAAVGQELLFRGVVLQALSARFSFWRANVAQGVLFGGWHLAWPLLIATSPLEPVVALPVYAVGVVVVTGTVGVVFGTLVRATGTLWAAVLAHLVHNATAGLVHVQTADGSDHSSVLSAAVVAGYAALAWLAWYTGENSVDS